MPRSPHSKRSTNTLLQCIGGTVVVFGVLGLALHAHQLDAPPAWQDHSQQVDTPGQSNHLQPQRQQHEQEQQQQQQHKPVKVHLIPEFSPVPVPEHELLPVNITAKPDAPFKLPYALWWFAPFYTGTGYGLEAQHYMLALLRAGLVRAEDLWISQHGDFLNKLYVKSIPVEERGSMRTMVMGPVDNQDRTAIMVCHSLPAFWSVPANEDPWIAPGGRKCPGPPNRRAFVVGRTMCEVDGIPEGLVNACNQMDEVWVPSGWSRDVFAASGVEAEKLVVVPEGVDTVKFDPASYDPVQLPVGRLVLGRRQERTVARRPYVFLSTFKWETRKGYDVLLKAYLQEFRPHEPVELYIMTKPFGKSGTNLDELVQDWVRRHLPATPTACADPSVDDKQPCPHPELPAFPTVYLITRHIPDNDLPRHYRAADCFVLPSRGEGWGRPHVEAMSMGLPLISTNWSGMTAYLNPDVGYPLALDGLIDADADNADYFKGYKWAQPSVAHLQQLMRHVVDNPEEARAKGRAAREHMVTEFSSEVVGLKVLREVLRITRTLQLQGVPRRVAQPTRRDEDD